MLSPLPFGVHRVHHSSYSTDFRQGRPVSIAFRRSPRPPHTLRLKKIKPLLASPLPFGVHRVHHMTLPSYAYPDRSRLHCLSAFTASTTPPPSTPRSPNSSPRLHCLSAFTASTTREAPLGRHGSKGPSPLPFGVHRVHHVATLGRERSLGVFLVSIAFRRSPRPPRRLGCALILALRMSPLPFGVHRVHHQPKPHSSSYSSEFRLHCLSAFTASTTTGLLQKIYGSLSGLHCLSAFTASTTGVNISICF